MSAESFWRQELGIPATVFDELLEAAAEIRVANNWPPTNPLIASITAEQLETFKAAHAEHHPASNQTVEEYLADRHLIVDIVVRD